MDVYGNEIPLQCTVCNKTFTGAVPAKQHFNSAAHKKKEVTARQLAGTGAPSYLVCDICNIRCDTVMILEHHKASPRHLAEAEKKRQLSEVDSNMSQSSNATNIGRMSSFPADQNPGLSAEVKKQREYDFDGNRGFCYLCDVELTSSQHATQHLNGSKHKKKQVLQRAQNLRPAQSLGMPEVQRNDQTNNLPEYRLHDFEETSQKQVVIHSRDIIETIQPLQSNMSSNINNDRLYCETCDIRVENLESMIDHYKSSKHEANLLNKNIQLSRSSSAASGIDSDILPTNNPNDYVSYTAITEQMSALGLSSNQQGTFNTDTKDTMKTDHAYGATREIPENKLQKYFSIDSANLKLDSLLSEESSLSYRTAEDQSTEEIVAKPFPREDSPRIGPSQCEENNGNMIPSASHAVINDFHMPVYGGKVMNRSMSASNAEPGPRGFIRNNFHSPTGDIGSASMPLMNNAGEPVAILNNNQNKNFPTKTNNVSKQSETAYIDLRNVKQEQSEDQTSAVSNLAKLLQELQFRGEYGAKPFTSEQDIHDTIQSADSIIAKPFTPDTPDSSLQGDSINAKPFSLVASLTGNQLDTSVQPVSSGQNPNEASIDASIIGTGSSLNKSAYGSQIQTYDDTGNARLINFLPDEHQITNALQNSSGMASKTIEEQRRAFSQSEPDFTFDNFLTRGHCNICDLALTSKQHMEQHLSGRKHANAKALKETCSNDSHNRELFCDVCLVPFSGPEAQEMHLKSDKHKKKVEQKSGNYKLKVFMCEVCQVECSGEDNYKQHLVGEKHLKRMRGNVSSQTFYNCEFCSCVANTPEQLAIHHRAKHPENFLSGSGIGMEKFNTNMPNTTQAGGGINGRPGFYFCEVCKVECSGEDNYRQHLLGEKHKKKIKLIDGNNRHDFFCDVCKVECSGEESYNQHIAGEKHAKKAKGYATSMLIERCDICNCEVNSSEQLWVHQRQKHPEKFQTALNVGGETFKNTQPLGLGMGGIMNTGLAGQSDYGMPGPVSSPLEEFLSLELFPENNEHNSTGNVDNEVLGHQSAIATNNQSAAVDRTFITPEITTRQPVQVQPRFAAVPYTDGNNSLGVTPGETSGSGVKRGQGSDLAWATKNRSSGNQNNTAKERLNDPVTGNGNANDDAYTGNQRTGHHFLDKLTGENPFATTHAYYCHTCKSPANTRESYESHLMGKRHMSKVGTEPAPVRGHSGARELGKDFKPQTKSSPRDYQWELFLNAMRSDTVCFLPTGTGKTMVSVMLMSAMLEKYPTRPVLFVVDKVLLVLQQSKYITTELGEFEFKRYNPDGQNLMEIGKRRLKIATLCMDQQSTHGVPLWKHDIIVVTAAFCQHLLDRKIIRWQDFSLVVVDEAHHCDKKHPFNVLLYSHHLSVYAEHYRPKILGLTASPAGKDTVPATVAMLEKLVANMGGVAMNIVQKYKSTLAKFQSNAQIIVRPQPDQFNAVVAMFISELQVYLVYCYLRLVPISDILVYIDLKDVNQSSNDEKIRVFAKLCIEENLEELQLALTNIQCREIGDKYNVRLLAKHAESICITLNSLLEGGVPCALEEMNGLEHEEYNFAFAKQFRLPCEKLQSIYTYTKELAENPGGSNSAGGQQFGSHVSRLVEELTNSLDIDWSRRETVKPMALVLVKERATVHKITKMLQSNDVMQRMNLRVASVVGHGKTGGSEAAGMRVNQQKRVLEEIKQYKYQVIIATSVAEEGVDWPECELVVSLYPPSSLTALVQMRGRARKKDSKFVVLCSCEEERQIIEDLKKHEENMMVASELLFQRSLQS